MKTVLYMMRGICAVEGFSGFAVYLILFCSLLRSRAITNRIFLVPIYIFSLHGLYLCVAIAFMNFTHIFDDGTFAIPLVGPSVQFISKEWREFLYQAAFFGMSFMWTLTPATSILQFTALSWQSFAQRERLCIAFTPTILCSILIAYNIPMTIPSPELSAIMERSMKRLYGMDDSEVLECYGLSMKFAHLNGNKSLAEFAITYAFIPYSSSSAIVIALLILIRKLLSSKGIALSKRTMKLQRQFFVMQLQQSVLPFVILSVPFVIVMYGVLTGAQLSFWSLPLTVFVWLCPVVQASVQLRYVNKSSATSSNSTTISIVQNVTATRSSLVA